MKKITGNHRNPSTSLVGLESAGTHLPQFFLNSGGGKFTRKVWNLLTHSFGFKGPPKILHG